MVGWICQSCKTLGESNIRWQEDDRTDYRERPRHYEVATRLEIGVGFGFGALAFQDTLWLCLYTKASQTR
jgi:hypothetical protein